MQGIERTYCDECVRATVGAWKALMETSATEALNKVRYGKGDTLGLDAIPEINISEKLRDFDNHAILVTEELDDIAKKRWPSDADPVKQPLMFFSDPTDRSKQLGKFIEKISAERPFVKIGELMENINAESVWEDLFEAPATITGASTSITGKASGSSASAIVSPICASLTPVS